MLVPTATQVLAETQETAARELAPATPLTDPGHDVPPKDAAIPSVEPVPTATQEDVDPHAPAARELAPWGRLAALHATELPDTAPSATAPTFDPPTVRLPTATHEVDVEHAAPSAVLVPGSALADHDDDEPAAASPDALP